MRLLKWLYPGMKVKRWLVLAIVGVLFFGMGSALLTAEAGLWVRLASLLIVLLGLGALLVGVMGTVRSLLDVVLPMPQRELVDVVFQRRHLDRGPKVVAVGGGVALRELRAVRRGSTDHAMRQEGQMRIVDLPEISCEPVVEGRHDHLQASSSAQWRGPGEEPAHEGHR